MVTKIVLFLFALILPCLVHSTPREGGRDLPYFPHDGDPFNEYVVNYLFGDETADDSDESQFDFVGHKDESDKKMDQTESAVKKDVTPKTKEFGDDLDLFENTETHVASSTKHVENKRKDSIAKPDVLNSDDDDIQGMSLENIRNHILDARTTITKHVIDNKVHDAFDMYNDGMTDKKQQVELTKNLIGLLYDFKGKRKSKHLSDTEPEDDLMDIGAKKDKLPTSPEKVKSQKEKIDVFVNVNINGVADKSKKKKKSEVANTKKNESIKPHDEPAAKRSFVGIKNMKTTAKVVPKKEDDSDDSEDDDDDDDEDGDDDEDDVSGRSPSSTTRVSSTLAHLKDIKAPPALINQLKEKIQEENASDEEDDDEDNDSDLSGSGIDGDKLSKPKMKESKKRYSSAHHARKNKKKTAKFHRHVKTAHGKKITAKEALIKKEDRNDELIQKKTPSRSSVNSANETNEMTLEEVRAKVKQWQKKKQVVESDTDESETRSWKDEKTKLVSKAKNPLLVAKRKNLLNNGEEPNDTAEIAKSAADEFSKIVDTVTTPTNKELRKTEEKDVKEIEASAEKAFANVVQNVMSGKADLSLSHHALSKSANDLISNVKDASPGSNMKKLMKFKSQILTEIKKIQTLQTHYGKHVKGSNDLSEARSVLEKDLKVVNELENRLKFKHTNNKQEEMAHHDQRAFGAYTNSQTETIPDDRLGFTSEERASKHGKGKGKRNHALEEIQHLLKDEIKRLKKKKTGKPDPQLNIIRKAVQKKLKGFLKNGDLDKNAFKKLAPEIKELGALLKHRIKNAKSYHETVLKATNADLAASHGVAPTPVEHKGLNNELGSTSDLSTSLRMQSQTLRNAQNTLARIQASNISLIGGQSGRMKSLLNSLNSKLGKVFKGNKNGGNNKAGYQASQTQGMYPQSQYVHGAYAAKYPSEPVYVPKSPYQVSALAKAETPLPDFEPDQTKPMADNEPVGTLIEALERDITEVWSYKDQYPNAESLGLDNEKVHNAYANLGSLSGLSLRRSLDRALRGEDVGLAIVGGSISKGGPFSEKGLDYVLKSYFYAIEDYWNKIIRPVTGSSLVVRDCSIGGISTDYYSYCLRNHLPDDKLTNIVLWELSANDMKRYEDAGKERTQPLEQFVRNVISYRAKPSLIFVNFFANFDWDPDLAAHCRNFEDEGGDDIAKYYKITSLSWRNMVCPELQAGTPLFSRDKLFAEDKFHPSIQGHAQVAYLLIDYIRTEFLKNLVKMKMTNIADAVTRLQIPHSIYVPRPLFRDTYLWKPLCFTYMMVDDRQPNNTLLVDATTHGSYHSEIVRAFKIRSDKIAGMNTLDKDQYVRYAIHLPPHPGGNIQSYKKVGIMTFTDGRSATVQFDAEPSQILDSGKKFLEGTVMKYISKDVRPGEHSLSVRSGDNGFLVSAIVVA